MSPVSTMKNGFSMVSALLVLPMGAAEPLAFNRDIRPILSKTCFTCHGPDAAAVKGELRLDLRERRAERRRIRETRHRPRRPGGFRSGPPHHQQGPGGGDAAAGRAHEIHRPGCGNAHPLDQGGRELRRSLGIPNSASKPRCRRSPTPRRIRSIPLSPRGSQPENLDVLA